MKTTLKYSKGKSNNFDMSDYEANRTIIMLETKLNRYKDKGKYYEKYCQDLTARINRIKKLKN